MNMYPTFHEMDEEKFVEALNQIIRLKEYPARLQRVRKECGYSQRQLSEKSGVNLRTLQQYELKTKDINKAAVGTVVALSKAIGCELEDILEYKGLE